MKIYTRTGDAGQTGLLGGERVQKNHVRIAAYGDLDELNAVLGMALAAGLGTDLAAKLRHIQNSLFNAGSELAAPDPARFNLPLLSVDASGLLENWIDAMDMELPKLQNFILPSGTAAASALHLARTVCRRAERSVVTLSEHATVRPEIIVYLNRLSDFLFTASRYENYKSGYKETVWKA